MPESDNELNQMAVAYGWVARVTTVVMEMALPALGGQWLDSKWGTNYWVIVGFVLGFALGMFHLLQMVKQQNLKTLPPNDDSTSKDKK